MKKVTLTRVLAVAALVVVVAACNAESIAENAIERELGGDVDLNLEDGSFSIEADLDGDGQVDSFEASANEDGVSVTSNGEEVLSSESSAELPDEWPADIPVPTNMAIEFGSHVTSGGQTTTLVSGNIGPDPEPWMNSMTSLYEGAGFEVSLATQGDGGYYSTSFNATGGLELLLSVTTAPHYGSEGDFEGVVTIQNLNAG